MTKLNNCNCNKTKKKMVTKIKKMKLGQISKNKIVIKLKKIKLSQNSKNQIVTVVIVTLAVVTVVILTSFSINNLTPQQQMKCSWCSFLQFSQCFATIMLLFGYISATLQLLFCSFSQLFCYFSATFLQFFFANFLLPSYYFSTIFR